MVLRFHLIGVRSYKNVLAVYKQQRSRSACTFAQSDQLHFLEGTVFNLTRALCTSLFLKNSIPSFKNSVDLDQLASDEAS